MLGPILLRQVLKELGVVKSQLAEKHQQQKAAWGGCLAHLTCGKPGLRVMSHEWMVPFLLRTHTLLHLKNG